MEVFVWFGELWAGSFSLGVFNSLGEFGFENFRLGFVVLGARVGSFDAGSLRVDPLYPSEGCFSNVRAPKIPKNLKQMVRTKIVHASGTFLDKFRKNIQKYI